jgi:hypothetical protein
MGRYSNFLYADPSFTEGMARILDFGDTLTEYNRSLSPEQADAIALNSDWRAVIEDLAKVLGKTGDESGPHGETR